MQQPMYYRAMIPRPVASWNRSGQATVTVRVGGAYEVYLCVGYQRYVLRAEEAWALLAALRTALPAEFGAAPSWTNRPVRQEAA